MEESGSTLAVAVLVILVLVVLASIVSAVKIVPEGVNLVTERLGRYQRTLAPGLHILIPAVDWVRAGVETTAALDASREIEGSALTALRKTSAGWGIQIGRVDVVSVERG